MGNADRNHYDIAGYGKPLGQQPIVISDHPDYKWIALAVSNVVPSGPTTPGTQLTLFDLRQLRYRNIDLPRQWEHFIYSYDLLVLLPQLSVASVIQ